MKNSPQFFLVVSLSLSCSMSGFADEPDKNSIKPPDVYLQVELLRAELVKISAEMGKPAYTEREIAIIEDASPREVYFQAATLSKKANQFCFEHLRVRADLPSTPQEKLLPYHVRLRVLDALQKVRAVKKQLTIPEESTPPQRDPSKTPTDVIRSIVHANRHLNQLLDSPFRPSDVFQEVTLGLSYASLLMTRFPNVNRTPADVEFVRKKRPRDVFEKLVDCYSTIRSIGERSKVTMLKLSVRQENLQFVTPSDVYDVASIIVAELDELHSRIPESVGTPRSFYPGRKLPAHVFQRAEQLRRLLEVLDRQVKGPEWLSSKGGD